MPPTIDQVVRAQMDDFRELARSGITELTGKSRRAGGWGEGEFVGRFGGIKTGTAFERLDDSPKIIAEAIDRGKGKVFDRVYRTLAKEAEREGFKKEKRKRSPGRPVVPPHEGRSYCGHCREMHAKGQHRFHGDGSFHRTHAFSFGSNPEEVLAESEDERRRKLYGGRRTDLLREKKQFDLERLEQSPLFAPTKRQKEMFPEENPRMTEAGAKRVFSGLMQLAQRRELTDRERQALAIARARLRITRRAAMNPKRRKGMPSRAEMRKVRRRMRRGKIVKIAKTNCNPGGRGAKIYGQVLEIICRRVGPHRCDAACKRVNHTYKHTFKSKPAIYGLTNGSLLIKAA